MLQNRLYRGEIVHKGAAYPGQHAAIIDQTLWGQVQQVLVTNRVDRASGAATATPSQLTGLVYDGAGERMSPTHANKRGTRYRYYVSQSLIKGSRSAASGAACRVPAADLESIVEERLRALLRDGPAIYDAISEAAASVPERTQLLEAAGQLASRWPTLSISERRATLHLLIARVTVKSDSVDLEVRVSALPAVLTPNPGKVVIPNMDVPNSPDANDADAPV